MKRSMSAPHRRQLLSTVSAAALLGWIGAASADDADRPVLWLEAGGQFERMQAPQEAFAPPFVAVLNTNPFTHPQSLQKLPPHATGEDAKILFRPEDSDWVFSASIRYGRSDGGNKHTHEETAPASPAFLESIPAFNFYRTGKAPARAKRFADTLAHESEKHEVIDFEAGKDVGLGVFGAGSSSTLNAGVRFAQFSSRSNAVINADPDFAVSYKYATELFGLHGRFNIPQQNWHLFAAKADMESNFHGLGPLVSWDASVPLAGNPHSEDVTLDWGLNAAILFGRQKVQGHHSTNAHYVSNRHFSGAPPLVYDHAYSVDRSRSVTVPNLGGFAGLSLRFPNAKVSIGCRADFFFNAVDGGVDTRKSENRAFYGPFASVSVGLGD